MTASMAVRERSIIESFERDFADVLRNNGVPGMTYAVVRGNQTIAASGIGVADVTKPHSPVDADTLFMVGSVSKSMTAALLATLVDDGTLLFTSRINDVLPLFRLKDPLASAQCTLEDAMLHRTGMADQMSLFKVAPDDTVGDFLGRLKHMEPAHDFRSTWDYTSMLWAVVGHAAAAASGRDVAFEDAMQRRLFDAAGMKTAVASPARLDADSANIAVGHTPRLSDSGDVEAAEPHTEYFGSALAAPGAMVRASAADMAAYMRMLLGGGVAQDGVTRVLSESTVARLFRGRTPDFGETEDFPPPSHASHFYNGYGWFTATYRGKHRIVYHAGTVPGIESIAALFPDDDLAVFASVNLSQDRTGFAAALHLADRFLGYHDVDWAATYGDLARRNRAARRPPPPRTVGTQPSRPLDAFAGRFEHSGYGAADVTLVEQDGAVARLSVKLGRIETALEHAEYDTFVGRVDGRSVDFTFFSTTASPRMQKLNIQLEPAIPEIIFTRIN